MSLSEPRRELPGWRQAAALLALALLAYLGAAWHAEFLNFDDPRFFGPASELQRAGWRGVLDPTATIAEAYLPVSHASLLFDLRWHGGSSRLVHLHALLLHVGAAIVLARLAGRLGLARWPATLVAALFLLHPALTESVLWASSRKDVLSGLFAFLALSATARGRGPLPVAGWTLLACYAKGSAIVVGPMALVVVWLLRRQGHTLGFRAAGVSCAVCAAAALHHAWLAAGAGTMAAPADAGQFARLAQVPGAFLHYLGTTLWPSQLNVLYPEVAHFEAFAAQWLPGLLAALAWLAAIAFSARRAPLCAAGLAIWLLALLPFNTAFPATALAAADRYLYLALPGAALALVAVPRVGVALAAVSLLPLLWLAHHRADDFRDSEALWTASLAVEPENSVAAYNLGYDRVRRGAGTAAERAALFARAERAARYPQHRWRAADARRELAEGRGDLGEAAEHAVRAADALGEVTAGDPAELTPLRVRAHLHAARLLRRTGATAAADAQLGAARELDADAPLVLAFEAARLHGELVAAAAEAGHTLPWPEAADDPRAERARELLERALQADPKLYEAHWTRGLLAAACGRFMAAEAAYRRAIALAPQRAEAHIARVELFLARPGMAAEAERCARVALDAGVRDPGLRFRLATALFQQGRFDDARENYEAYLRIRPDDERARADLAAVLAAVGYQRLHQLPPAELAELADRVLELDPVNSKGLLMRAVAARQDQRLDEALVLLERLREELPDDREVRQLHAQTVRDIGWKLKLAGGQDRRAYDMFRRFLDLDVAGVPTEAVENALVQRWRTRLRDGQQALIEGDLDTAERHLRRCLELRPAATGPNLQLGMVLMQRDAAGRKAALQCFERAEAGQREHGWDPSLAVLYQVRVLAALDRAEAARARARDYLDALPESADAETVARIREWLER